MPPETNEKIIGEVECDVDANNIATSIEGYFHNCYNYKNTNYGRCHMTLDTEQ